MRGYPAEIPATASTRAGRFPTLNLLLLAATVITTTLAGVLQEGVFPSLDPTVLIRGLPFSATLITILLMHEAGHYLMCRRHGVRASLPYFLPAPPFPPMPGTFGAFIRIRSRFPDRRALFDVAAAGPWAGFVVAAGAVAWGLHLSTVLPAPPPGPGIEFGDSLLTSLLIRLVLGAPSDTVVLHPVAFAGWLGLFVTCLNLLPAGQLDGGHVLYAALGRRTRVIPSLLIAALLWLGLRGWPGWLLWAGIITVLMALGVPPIEDGARPLGPGRRLATLATFVLFLLVFVPEPVRIIP
jgi:membrane-associated protease RseP (regulator of RpoE activity)